ncbi:MAG: NTPase [Chloroflexota bacterium]
MGSAILLTGAPGCGKTTLLQRVLARMEQPAAGFLTQEVRERGIRTGFEILTLDGRHGLLAHTRLAGRARVGKYCVNLQALEELAADSIRTAVRQQNLAVIDEIGPMELLSPPFRQAVEEALRSPCPVLATIMRRSHPFADWVKAQPEALLLEVRSDNREGLVDEILRLVGQMIHGRGAPQTGRS